jgi:hypothetical protein
MPQHFLTAMVTVKDGERALLTRNRGLTRVLEPGRERTGHTSRMEYARGLD